ncbi:alpha/beta fold hydrolase [Mycolicibacterium gadium]|uniref:Putative carboxylesterase nap n=1 Tax=Mycolicibacterium gadium TaxID=1794 RepID=A0A7I7WJR5_MYCGU|nr:alpha/beta fold hydrolase [Mycolicibacterium gadium]BBZ17182.1 putative carboxylesterase nap [Mycolicibacterium gadium]
MIVSGPESAPPLVLLHGAAATATMWRPVIETLSATYRCYCVDTIIEGNKSIASRRILGKVKLVEWLRRVFAALDIKQARVVGLSYGGWLAANLALHASELVHRLVLLCPAATFAPITLKFYQGVFSASLSRSPERARHFVQWLSSTPNVEADPIADLIVTALLSNKPVPTGLTPPTVLSDDALQRIAVPTTVLIGDREVIYRGGPHAAIARAQRLIPDVRTDLIPGANHILTLDCPKELAAELLTALA